MGVRCQGWPLIFAAWIRCSKTSKTAHTAKNGLAYTHSQIIIQWIDRMTALKCSLKLCSIHDKAYPVMF